MPQPVCAAGMIMTNDHESHPYGLIIESLPFWSIHIEQYNACLAS